MKPKIQISNENIVEIETPSGGKFQIVCKDNSDNIEVFANSSFGSVLVIKPRASNSIIIKEEKI